MIITFFLFKSEQWSVVWFWVFFFFSFSSEYKQSGRKKTSFASCNSSGELLQD